MRPFELLRRSDAPVPEKRTESKIDVVLLLFDAAEDKQDQSRGEITFR